MVKKRLATGEPCRKCVQTEDMLRRRGLWSRIDEVVWADENDPASPGMELAAAHAVDRAPFFLVEDDAGTTVYVSALALIKEHLGKEHLGARRAAKSPLPGSFRSALEEYGRDLAIAFSGSDDVVVIDMAARTGLPFSVLTIDTGRLHPETYDFIEQVRQRYALEIDMVSPDAAELGAFVRKKGLFSFYDDGHTECCAIRKVAPLRAALSRYRAWATGQRRDQSVTRLALEEREVDAVFTGAGGEALVKLNPLATWTRDDVWSYIREHGVPTNALFDRGFASIGCAPCTRPIGPGQQERDGRWWWEADGAKECGLHVSSADVVPLRARR